MSMRGYPDKRSLHRWDGGAECYVIDTPSGTRPSDPIIWKLKTQWDGWELTRRSPDGPFDLKSYCLETGLTVGRPRTFHTIEAAKKAALGVGQ